MLPARRPSRPRARRLALALGSLATVLAAAEVALRVAAPGTYYVWPPSLSRTLHPSPQYVPGVSGEARFLTSSIGLRGDEPPAGDAERILVVGGSTAECLYLDHAEAWPYAFQERLRSARPGVRAWVGNAGRSGLRTRHYQTILEKLLGQHPELDAVVVLAGINDLSRWLGKGAEPAEPEAELLAQAFQARPTTGLALVALARRAARTLDRLDRFQDDRGKTYETRRAARRRARTLVEELPDLRLALDAYAHNLEALVATARAHGTRIVLLTQPSLWRPDLSREAASLLWYGGLGDFEQPGEHDYHSVSALARAMQAYNATLLATCARRRIECVDLAASIPKETTFFYDDVHFTEAGAARVAQTLADHWLATDRSAGLNSRSRAP